MIFIRYIVMMLYRLQNTIEKSNLEDKNCTLKIRTSDWEINANTARDSDLIPYHLCLLIIGSRLISVIIR